MAIDWDKDDFPNGFVSDCAHSGTCDMDVAYWLSEIGLAIDEQQLVDYLSGYGAWDEDELKDHEQNKARLFWVSANDFSDGQELVWID